MGNVTKRSTHQPDLEQLLFQQTHQAQTAQQTKNESNGRGYRQRIPAGDPVASELMIRRIMAELLTVE